MASYIIKSDDRDISSDDISNYSEYKDEVYEVVTNRYISDMTEKYRDYKKISIFKKVKKL